MNLLFLFFRNLASWRSFFFVLLLGLRLEKLIDLILH